MSRTDWLLAGVACVLLWAASSKPAPRRLAYCARRRYRRDNLSSVFLILRAMHNAGFAEITWDEHGEPQGMVIKISGASGGVSDATADRGPRTRASAAVLMA